MSFDGDAHETRRNTTIAIGVAVAAVTMVALLYWLFNSMSGPALAVSPTALSTSTTTTAAPNTPAPSQTTDTPPPTIASWTPSTTFSLPPPEAPTMTAAVDTPTPAQQTAAATTQAPAPPPPPPPSPATPATPASPQPPAPSISNVNLGCSKGDGRKATATLVFDTTTKVDVLLSAGGQVDRKSAGPGHVSLTTNGRGGGICFARVGDQTVGPVPAS